MEGWCVCMGWQLATGDEGEAEQERGCEARHEGALVRCGRARRLAGLTALSCEKRVEGSSRWTAGLVRTTEPIKSRELLGE